jgi:hypothetical protein
VKKFHAGVGLGRLVVLVAGVGAVVLCMPNVSQASSSRHASFAVQGSRLDQHRRRVGDYTVNLYTSWVVEASLPRGTQVDATYIPTPGGCTTAERSAKFTIDRSPLYTYDFIPLFVAKRSGSCGLSASYADYDFAVKYPNGDTHDNKIRIEEDHTSQKYGVSCVATFLSCYPGSPSGTNATVTFRRP